jgi:hypothetical protein
MDQEKEPADRALRCAVGFALEFTAFYAGKKRGQPEYKRIWGREFLMAKPLGNNLMRSHDRMSKKASVREWLAPANRGGTDVSNFSPGPVECEL